ncbi:MAG: hypothetical protein WBA43_25250 [Elainellaceae cyanobacterium]
MRPLFCRATVSLSMGSLFLNPLVVQSWGVVGLVDYRRVQP